MLHINNSVVIFYRIRLTALSIFTNLSCTIGKRVIESVRKAGAVASAVVALAVAVSACTTLDARPAPEIVKQRSEARWSSLVKGDVGATYEFLTPTVRKTLTRDDYVANMRGRFWKAVTVDRVVCEAPALCNVELTVEYDYKSRRVKSPLQETWIQEGSNWWYAQK